MHADPILGPTCLKLAQALDPAYSIEAKMKMDSTSIAAVITAFSELPVRMIAMERALTELTAKVEALGQHRHRSWYP